MIKKINLLISALFIGVTAFSVNRNETNYNESDAINLNDNLNNNDYSLYGTQSLLDPVDYINSRYDASSVYMTEGYYLSGWVYTDQTQLNKTYNDNHNSQITGTCGVVACTSASYYIAKKYNYSNIPSDLDTIFEKYIGYYNITGSEGTSSSSYKNAIPWLFDTYGYTIKANRSTVFNKYTKMKEKARAKVPTIISTSNTTLYPSHAMVVIGYKTYKITYKNKNKDKTTTETYYAVDEGWGRDKPAYLLEGNMPGIWEITTIDI